MGLAGLSMDLIKDFVDKTNIGIDHFNFKEKKDDFETILDAIKKNHFVVARVDMYEFMYSKRPKLRTKFPNMTITLPQQLLKSALRAVNARQSQTLKQVFMI